MRLGSGVALALLLAAFTILALAHWPDEIDDVYIDALHARNWVEHGEVSLGAGEGPVEGYSSPLNVGLHALAYALHLPNVIALGKARALLAANATIVLLFFVLRRLGFGRALALSGAALLSFSACFEYWAVAGLETPIYALLLLAAVHGLAPVPHRAWAAWPLGLLAITRPEGPVFALVALGFLVLRAAREGALSPAFGLALARFAATIALIALPYFVFRWFTFGALFPNTYFAKITDYSSTSAGISYAWSFLTQRAPYVLAAFPLLFLPRTDRGRVLLLVASFLLAELAVIARAGGDWMPRQRFMTQVLPLLIVLSALGVQNLFASWRGWRSRKSGLDVGRETLARTAGILALSSRLALGVLALFVLGRVAVRAAGNVRGDDIVSEERIRSDAADYRAAAALMMEESARRGWTPSEVTVALEPVGIIPYFMRCVVIDLSGKTSREIARAVRRFGPERHREKDLWVADLVFQRRPEFFCQSGGMHANHQAAVMADPRFGLLYEALGSRGRMAVFVRRADLARSDELGLVSRRDGIHLIAAGDAPFALLAPNEAAQAARTALDSTGSVLVSVEIGGPATWFDELGALGRMQVRDQGRYFAHVALTRGEPLHATLFAGLRLDEAASLDKVFAPGSVPWKLERDPAPRIAIECSGPNRYQLLLLAPIALESRGLCLAWVECRVEERRGEPSGLYWGTFRQDPSHSESILESGNVLVPDASGEWRTLSAAIPVTDGAMYLSIGVGGVRNEGTRLSIRNLRVVMIPEIAH